MRRIVIAMFVVGMGCNRPAVDVKTPDPSKPVAAPSAARDALVKQLSDKLAEADRRLSEWEAQLPMKPADVQARCRSRLEAVRSRRGECAKRLAQLKDADAGGWALVKDSADRAFEELRGAVDQAAADFS